MTLYRTLDADGQHDPAVIPIITKPIVEGAADLVLEIRVDARPTSEHIIAKIIGLRVKCVDPELDTEPCVESWRGISSYGDSAFAKA